MRSKQLIVTQASYDILILPADGHSMPIAIYNATKEDRAVYYFTGEDDSIEAIHVPKEIYDMFMLSSRRDTLLDDCSLFLDVMLIYFLSYYPYSTDYHGKMTEDPKNLMIPMATNNSESIGYCFYTDPVKDTLDKVTESINELRVDLVHTIILSVVDQYETARQSSM